MQVWHQIAIKLEKKNHERPKRRPTTEQYIANLYNAFDSELL